MIPIIKRDVITLMRLNDASEKSFETGHANLYVFASDFFFLSRFSIFFYDLSVHLVEKKYKRTPEIRKRRQSFHVCTRADLRSAKRFRSVSDYNKLSS